MSPWERDLRNVWPLHRKLYATTKRLAELSRLQTCEMCQAKSVGDVTGKELLKAQTQLDSMKKKVDELGKGEAQSKPPTYLFGTSMLEGHSREEE